MKKDFNKSFWDDRVIQEIDREIKYLGKKIHTDLIHREIQRVIGARSKLQILDAGAGTGRYSIPLAIQGHKVTHFDIAPNMVHYAQEISRKKGLTNMEFLVGSVENLSTYQNQSFDLVLCLDAPLSFCVNTFPKAIKELVRVARDRIIVCVFNRLGVIFEDGLETDIQDFGELETSLDVYETGTLDSEKLRHIHPTLFPSWHAFTPNELISLFEENNYQVERLSAPGTLARFVKNEVLLKLVTSEKYNEFLDFEEKIDSDPSVLGVGGISAGGLMATFSPKK